MIRNQFRYLLLVLSICATMTVSTVKAQQADTINIISYNLDDISRGPMFSARASAQRDAIKRLRPQILVCQGVNDTIATVAAHALFPTGIGDSKSEYLGFGHSVLFYDSTRVKILDYNVIPTAHLPIDEWIMCVRKTSDTFIIASCQFVEGGDSTAVAARAIQAQALRAHLHQRRTEKVVIVGTLNFYSSYEDGFRWLTEDAPFGDSLLRNPVRDPIKKVGIWHRNKDFELWHTFSSSVDTTLDTSGLIDRFDYALMSPVLLSDYLRPGNYYVLGNYGGLYGKSVTNNGKPSGEAAPFLEKGSRHLPLYFDLIFRKTTTGVEGSTELPDTMDLTRVNQARHRDKARR